MPTQRSVLLFSQSSGDIIHTLALYEKFRNEKCPVSLFVINLENSYQYYQSLDLELELFVFIPYTKYFLGLYKNPFAPLAEKIRLKLLFQRYFSRTQDAEVYYFSNLFDWVTAFFISTLSVRNRIHMVDYMDKNLHISPVTSISLKKKWQLFIYWFITGIKFTFGEMGHKNYQVFPSERFLVMKQNPAEPDKELLKKYHPDSGEIRNPSILLFEYDASKDQFFNKYEETLSKIIQVCVNAGYTIYLKPHPRLGASEFLHQLPVRFIPAIIPGELLDLEAFTFIFGIITNAITSVSEEQYDSTYCLMNLFDLQEKVNRKLLEDSFLSKSNGKLKFLNTVLQLEEVLQSGLKKE